jgi:hypothetical protein
MQMLSAIKVIGACLIVLTAVYGLIAVALMLLDRIKNLFEIPGGQAVSQQSRPVRELKDNLRAIAILARNRPGRFLLGVAIVSVCVFFIDYVMLGLIVLGALAVMIAPIARRRGWGSEGRLTRYLNRPRFMDEGRRTDPDRADSVGRANFRFGSGMNVSR